MALKRSLIKLFETMSSLDSLKRFGNVYTPSTKEKNEREQRLEKTEITLNRWTSPNSVTKGGGKASKDVLNKLLAHAYMLLGLAA